MINLVIPRKARGSETDQKKLKMLKMRVPVKLLGFAVWLLCLNCGQCKDCYRDDINYENVEPVLEPSYGDGQTVNVTCQTGFTGIYRLKCENGKWSESIARPCAKKKCSHPGDIENGHFQLLDGTEYVFGTRVMYTCVKGYELTSRINVRTCRSQGWDNAVPGCEAVKCPAIHTNRDVIASGNTEEGNYGEVIHFECESSEKQIDGSKDIRCTETGDWSHPVPNCIGMCTTPDIPNAEIEGVLRQSYKATSTLRYKCNPGFEPEETVEIACDTEAQWAGVQECTVKQEDCRNLSVKNGFVYSQSSNKQEIFYSCNKGYKPFTGEWWSSATCVKGSWSDVPQCIREEECGALPTVQNGKLKRKDQETAEVDCDPGFISNPPSIKCIRGTWETPTCNEGVKCGIPPYVDNAGITSKPKAFYIDGSSVTYACRSPFLIIGKSTVFCNNGKWEETPTCEVRCLRPHENYMALANDKDIYHDKEILNYKCLKPYDIIPEGEWICENGKWTGNFVCTNGVCPPPPYIENGSYISRNPDDKIPTEVYYECQAHYVLSERRRYYRCENGRWGTPPKCLKPCQITRDILEAHNNRPDQRTGYLEHGYSNDYYCKDGRTDVRTGRNYMRLTCSDGQSDIKSCQ